MNKQSLSRNLIFQFIYQGLILVIPLVLSPYLTRVLQETAIGVYSYTNSIAYYFVLISNLGISRHGQRIVSQSSKNEITLRKKFWSLFTVHAIISAFVTMMYVAFVIFIVTEDKIIYIIQSFYVISALFDLTWLFYGLENFKSAVIKNTVVKVVECGLIFLLVKTPSDLWIYTMISTLGLLIGQLVMVPQAIKAVKPIRFTMVEAKQHIKPLLIFSISMIAVTLYTVFAKTLLGLMTTKENVGFYEYSNKIVTIPKTVISVIGTVMFPRACRMAAQGDVVNQKKYINYSFLLTSFIAMGSIFGLLAIGRPFATFYYGGAFSVCGTVIMALCPIIFIIGIGDIIRTQYMIPNHMDKHFNLCILLNAIVNIILSTSLIPTLGIYGAVIGTVSAEVFGIIYQVVLCRKFIKLSDILGPAIPFLISGFVMFLVIKAADRFIMGGLKGLLLEMFLGGCVYMALSAVYVRQGKRELWNIGMAKIKRQ